MVSKAVSKKKNRGKTGKNEIIPEDTILVYHKPNCNTSRTVMEFLKKEKVKVMVRLYLEDSPTEKELEILLAKLHIKPHDLIRIKEPYYQKKLKGLKLNDHEWIKVMVQNPVLIERPVLIRGNKAIIGRPIEKVMEFIKK